MKDFNKQIAEFAFPFPSTEFEIELKKNGIKYRKQIKESYEGGTDSCIFYTKTSDFDIAFKIKNKVDKENAKLELKYTHPLIKNLAYLLLTLIIIYIVYKIFNFLN